MKIYLLDRNAVVTIKKKLAGKKILPTRDSALRKLDKSGNLISPILSIREGQTGIRENKQQHQQTLEIETRAISKFFKKASTDCDFLAERSEEFSKIFSNNIEHKWDDYISFIIEIQSILYQPISKNQKDKFKHKIFEVASNYDIPETHPVVICSLSVLYGCDKTRSILKAKPNRTEIQRKKDAYNAVNDLIIISRLHLIQAVDSEADGKNNRIIYFTFDSGLDFFLNSIVTRKVESVEVSGNTKTISNISYKSRLFPELNGTAFTELMKYLQNISDKITKQLCT